MTKEKNAAWRFLASVKLALVTLFILSAASIIGTVIKQKQPTSYYTEAHGETLASLFEIFSLTDMYASWWFIALLALFAVNLVVCSIERIPGAWRLATADNLDTNLTQLEQLPFTHRIETALPADHAAERLRDHLTASGWGLPGQRTRDGAQLLFCQKGAWSRFGVYVVHLSILVVIIGAAIGKAFGYKAYVYLPEGRTTTAVFQQGSAEPIPLEFELHCDNFQRNYYPNGMIREYRADLTITDPRPPVSYSKSIVVNDPLSYDGITFYVGDSYPLDEYIVVVRNQTNGREQTFRIPAQRDVPWEGTPVTFRIEALRSEADGTVRQAQIHFADDRGEPSLFWMNERSAVTISRVDGDYTFSLKQMSSVLLLVTKDPGVWVVWGGCTLLIIGLIQCFCLAHRRLWVRLVPHKQGTRILLGGSSNKQRPLFERRFKELVERLEGDATLSLRDKKGKNKT
jgi:cytochrome c biogenesis protein